MKILLDTCILSELRRPESRAILKNALSLFEAHQLFISVISIGEITKSISLLPISKKKTDLLQWSAKLEKNYVSRTLSINSDIAHLWGELTAKAQKSGKQIPTADGLIAATALAHGLHVMTRNVDDFKYTGVLLLNPWNDYQ